MVKINFCPSCGFRLSEGSFICPSCGLDIERLFDEDFLLVSNRKDNSIQWNDAILGEAITDGDMLCDEIVLVVSESCDGDEIVIDLNELGIDAENFSQNINIIVQVTDSPDNDVVKASEWHFEGDPYGISYYEFPKE